MEVGNGRLNGISQVWEWTCDGAHVCIAWALIDLKGVIEE